MSRPSSNHAARRTALMAALLAGCSVSTPVLLPPPFDVDGNPDHGRPVLLLPTGITAAPSGQLLVVSSNLDRLYDSGTLTAFSKEWVDAAFSGADGTVLTSAELPKAPDSSSVLVPDYGGPVALDEAGKTAWLGSRTTNLATAVRLDPATGKLSCVIGGGSDCRAGTIQTKDNFKLEGPYGVVAGKARLAGETLDRSVMFVSSLVPYVESIVNNTPLAYGRLMAISAENPTEVLFTLDASSPAFAGGVGAGEIIYDAFRRQLIAGGCFIRFVGGSGDPATSKCSVNLGVNPIRFIDVTSGKDGAVKVLDLSLTVRGNETTGLVLGNEDATGKARTLYALSRSPDVLVEITLPEIPGQEPHVSRVVSLPVSPSHAIRVKRPAGSPGSDLIAVVSAGNGALSIYDAGAGEVVAQINGLGDYPFRLAQLETAGTRARLAATVFGGCRVAFMDVDLNRPSEARLRGLMGKCR